MTFTKMVVGGGFAFTVLFATLATAGESDVKASKEVLVYLKDSLGLKMLQTTKYAGNFPRLANNFESQKNRLLCGPTSAVIVLNTLRGRDFASTNPQDTTCFPAEAYQYLQKDFNPLYPRYTQNNFFTADTDKFKTLLQVYGQPMPETGKADYGCKLRELKGMLEAHGLAVEMRSMDGSMSHKEVVKELSDNLKKQDVFIIVNYLRTTVGQTGDGHFSPLGAYHPGKKYFLVMDTAPSKADWVWIDANTLIDAMSSLSDGEYRGYLLVADGATTAK